MKHLIGTFTVLVLLVAAPSSTIAHQGNPDFRSEITSITPAAAGEGLKVQIENFDDNVQIVNRTGNEVVIKGYDGEPYVRMSPEGTVEVNLNSPAYYLNEDRFADVTLPKRADTKATPAWKVVDDTGLFSWHDHRSHYMGLNTPPQVKDESIETKVFDYSIPTTVGGKPVEINGTLTWVGDQSGFSFKPFIALAVLIVVGLIGVSIIRRRRDEDDGDDSGEAGPEDDRGPVEAW